MNIFRRKKDVACRYYNDGACRYHGKYCNGVCMAWVRK